jgi:hypothetical protein
MLTAIILFALQWSCGRVERSSDMTLGDAGTGASGTGGTVGLPPSFGGTGGTTSTGGAQGCDDEIVSQVLSDQTVSVRTGQPRVFYSWTTDEQVAEFRGGSPLFSRTERPGEGPGQAFMALANFAASGNTPEQKLAAQLGALFEMARFAWTNPWATRLGWPGESYGNQLLQIELKAEAWIAIFIGQGFYILDAQDRYIPIETALANIERIGAIYYLSSPDGSTTYCGTFGVSASGYREFILGNIQMVLRWSLATPEIAGRLTSDIAELEAFEAILDCAGVPDLSSWVDGMPCEWADPYFAAPIWGNYDRSLAMASELYLPTVNNIEVLIAALQSSMPTGEPLIVTPGG